MSDLASLGIKVTTDGVQQAQADLDKLAASGDKAAKSTDNLSKATANSAKAYSGSAFKQQQADLAKLAGQIDPTIAALDRLDKQQSKLAQFKKSGLLSSDDFTALNGAIEANRAKLATASDTVHTFSLNNANARRELGYLAKDMATGQWGNFQRSFGTLLNATGLLGAAFSATGIAIGAAVGSVVAFALAANSASEDTNKFNKALAETGNYVGVASEGMSKFASQVAGNNADIGKANDILVALAKNGKVTGETFLSLGQAAMDMSRLTGASAEDAAKSVTGMFDGTAASAQKANEQYHFLTLELYDQIAALEKEGNSQDAVLVAARAFHDEISPRIDEMKGKVTGLAAAWDSVKESAGNFWQQFKNGAALLAGTADLQTQIYALMGQKESAQSGNPFTFSSWKPSDQAKLEDLQKQLKAQTDAADAKAQEEQVQTAGIAGQSMLDKYSKQYESDEKKREDALIAIHNAANKAIAAALAKGDTDLANQIMAQEAQADSDARASFAKKLGGKSDDIDATILAKKQMTEAINKEIEGYKKELTQQAQNTTAIANYKAAMEDKLKTDQAAIDLQVAAVGMGKQQVALQREIIQVQAEADKQLEQLNRDYADKSKGMTQETYDAQLAAIKDFEAKRIAQISKGNADVIDAQKDWRNGMLGAVADFEDKATDVAGSTRNLFTNAFDGIGDALANFATKGKLSFADLADSIISDLIKIDARIAVSNALQSIFGSYTPGTDNLAQIDRNTASINNFKPNALGGVYASDSLSAFSGRVVDKPTMFAFAKGAGLMGEAGPEAILPLTRSSDGKLGVQSSGSGGGTKVEVINNSGSQATTTQGTNPDGTDWVKVIIGQAVNEVDKRIARGGSTSMAINKAFGLSRRGIPVSG